MRTDLPTGTVTFLFTDIEGSTRLLAALGPERYAAELMEHRATIRSACRANGGTEVDTQGDAFFFVFPTAVGAIQAAAGLTGQLATGPIRVRVGLHTGTPLRVEEGYVGDDVHLAARVAAAAHGGQVVLTEATRASLDQSVTIRTLGEHRLKDIPDPVSLSQLGDARFPPLRTVANTNLPASTDAFIGRREELDLIIGRIAAGGRLLTLTGPGGSGKSRLALEAARVLRPDFPAGTYWIPLASLRDPAVVISTIEQTIGAKVDLAGHIGERRMLLVIDNLEQVIDAAPELARLSEGCPALVLIITSRELLRVSGEAGIAVPPLGSDDAVELFRERSAAPVSPTVAELCDRLDRLPLAVELAAARSRAMSPAAMLDRLGRRLDLLRGGRDIDPRQQTLRATVEWSHDLLHLSEQELFRGLGVFAGNATLEAIETILEADLEDLQSLVDKSLVGYADDRYRMLETIREFAAERLDASPDAEVIRHRHAAWIQDFVDRADAALEGSGQEVWLARSSAEHDDIRAGLAWSIRTGQADPAIAIAGSSATFWWIAGHWSEGRRWLAEALAIPGATDHRRKAKALEGLANLDVRLGDFGAAQVEASESLRISQTRGDLRGIARATRVLCIAAWGAGRAEEAREYARQSEATARAAGDPWALSMALNNLGYEALEVGAYAEALALLDEAVALARERGDRRSEAFFVENVAMARFNLDGARAARHDFARSLDIADSLGFLEVVATDLIGAAAVADQDGDPSRAAMLLGGAERIVQQTGGGLDTAEARMRDATLEAIRRRLGPELERVFELGRSTEPAEVVAIALATLETDRGSEGG